MLITNRRKLVWYNALKAYVKVEYDGGKVFETIFRCGKCRANLIDVKHSIDYYNCKKCGMKALEECGEMLWD